MPDQYDSAANDLLQYPKDLQEFLAVVALFGRAREVVRKPGEGFNEALLRTTDEIDAALAIFRQVWNNAEAGRNAGVSASGRQNESASAAPATAQPKEGGE